MGQDDDPDIWNTKDGRTVRVNELNGDHLANIIRYIHRNNHQKAIPQWDNLLAQAKQQKLPVLEEVAATGACARLGCGRDAVPDDEGDELWCVEHRP